jgi:hypothetical protein
LNVPCFGSTTFHDMLISAVVRPSDLSAAKLASDQAVPLLSKSSWVDHIGVVDAAGVAAPALTKGAATRAAITRTTGDRGRDRDRVLARARAPLDFFLNIIAFRLS